MGIDLQPGVAALARVLFGLQYAGGHAVGMHEPVLSPEVRQCLVLPECAALRHVVPIDVFLRTYLLVHRDTQQGSKGKVYGTEQVGVDFVEVLFCPFVVETSVLCRIHVEVQFLHMV